MKTTINYIPCGLIPFAIGLIIYLLKYYGVKFSFQGLGAWLKQPQKIIAFIVRRAEIFYAFLHNLIKNILAGNPIAPKKEAASNIIQLSFLDFIYRVFIDFILKLLDTWYILVILFIISFLLHFTNVGIKISIYFLEQLSDYSIFWRIVWLFSLILACYLFAFTCWIIPKYDEYDEYGIDLNEKNKQNSTKINNLSIFKVESVSIFYILALAFDISTVGEINTDKSQISIVFLLLSTVFFVGLSWLSLDNKKIDKNNSLKQNLNVKDLSFFYFFL